MDNAMNTAALETLVAEISKVAIGYTISLEIGKRYARIVKADGSGFGRSAYGFVDLTNGDLLKSAGWKGPAKGVRGNALRGQLGCCGQFSIR